MRISDWSSDVCSSDLTLPLRSDQVACGGAGAENADPGDGCRVKSRVLIIVLAVVLVVLAVSTGVFSRLRGTQSAVAAAGTVAGVVAATPVVRQQQPDAPRRVLAGWDERRAAAWASGSVTDLRALYVEGSAAGRVDVRMLKAWLRKRVRV